MSWWIRSGLLNLAILQTYSVKQTGCAGQCRMDTQTALASTSQVRLSLHVWPIKNCSWARMTKNSANSCFLLSTPTNKWQMFPVRDCCSHNSSNWLDGASVCHTYCTAVNWASNWQLKHSTSKLGCYMHIFIHVYHTIYKICC